MVVNVLEETWGLLKGTFNDFCRRLMREDVLDGSPAEDPVGKVG